jgi:hypothetical protein
MSLFGIKPTVDATNIIDGLEHKFYRIILSPNSQINIYIWSVEDKFFCSIYDNGNIINPCKDSRFKKAITKDILWVDYSFDSLKDLLTFLAKCDI